MLKRNPPVAQSEDHPGFSSNRRTQSRRRQDAATGRKAFNARRRALTLRSPLGEEALYADFSLCERRIFAPQTLNGHEHLKRQQRERERMRRWVVADDDLPERSLAARNNLMVPRSNLIVPRGPGAAATVQPAPRAPPPPPPPPPVKSTSSTTSSTSKPASPSPPPPPKPPVQNKDVVPPKPATTTSSSTPKPASPSPSPKPPVQNKEVVKPSTTSKSTSSKPASPSPPPKPPVQNKEVVKPSTTPKSTSSKPPEKPKPSEQKKEVVKPTTTSKPPPSKSAPPTKTSSSAAVATQTDPCSGDHGIKHWFCEAGQTIKHGFEKVKDGIVTAAKTVYNKVLKPAGEFIKKNADTIATVVTTVAGIALEAVTFGAATPLVVAGEAALQVASKAGTIARVAEAAVKTGQAAQAAAKAGIKEGIKKLSASELKKQAEDQVKDKVKEKGKDQINQQLNPNQQNGNQKPPVPGAQPPVKVVDPVVVPAKPPTPSPKVIPPPTVAPPVISNQNVVKPAPVIPPSSPVINAVSNPQGGTQSAVKVNPNPPAPIVSPVSNPQGGTQSAVKVNPIPPAPIVNTVPNPPAPIVNPVPNPPAPIVKPVSNPQGGNQVAANVNINPPQNQQPQNQQPQNQPLVTTPPPINPPVPANPPPNDYGGDMFQQAAALQGPSQLNTNPIPPLPVLPSYQSQSQNNPWQNSWAQPQGITAYRRRRDLGVVDTMPEALRRAIRIARGFPPAESY